ncbi:MAG: hypothetical protein ACKOTA_09915, partial [Solirubrobacterales bacterium]
MLGQPSRKKRKHLIENGTRATAVVLKRSRRIAVTTGPENVVDSTELDFRLKLRVEPEGQEAFEVGCRMRFPQMSAPEEGSRIPVIFDPEDRDEIMWDDTPAGIGTLTGNDSVGELLEMAAAGADEQALVDAAMQMFPGAATTGPGGGAVIDLRGQGPAAQEGPAGDPRVADLEKLAALHASGA